MSKVTTPHGKSIEIIVTEDGSHDMHISPAGAYRLSAALTAAVNARPDQAGAMALLSDMVDTNFDITDDETDAVNYSLTQWLLYSAAKAFEGAYGEEIQEAMEAGKEAGRGFLLSLVGEDTGTVH